MSDDLFSVGEVQLLAGACGTRRLARTALAWLAERDAVTVERDEAKEACDLLEMERDDACGKLDDLRADLHNVRAHSVAAEEARDLAIVERDEAYKQRDEATGKILQANMDRYHVEKLWDKLGDVLEQGDESMIQAAERIMAALVEARRERDELGREGDTAHALLNDSIGSRVTPRKGETVLVSQARTAAEVIGDLRLQLRAIEDARAILGAAPDELLSDAARRVRRDQEMAAAANQPRKDAMAATRAALETPDGVTVFERASDVMAELRLLREAAEAEPPQVFRIQHEITIAGDLVTIRVAPLRDPAIRALPMGVRLGLVVCDE